MPRVFIRANEFMMTATSFLIAGSETWEYNRLREKMEEGLSEAAAAEALAGWYLRPDPFYYNAYLSGVGPFDSRSEAIVSIPSLEIQRELAETLGRGVK